MQCKERKDRRIQVYSSFHAFQTAGDMGQMRVRVSFTWSDTGFISVCLNHMTQCTFGQLGMLRDGLQVGTN